MDELCEDLQFVSENANKFEAAIDDLARFIGIDGQRPEKDYGAGPDNLWVLPNNSFLVIECKNGAASESGISKRDAGQLGQSVEWFNKQYSASKCTPIIIHPKGTLGDGASAVSGMRVITPDRLEKLRKNLRGFVAQLADPDIAANASKVSERLVQFELNADKFVNAYSVPAK